VLNHRLRTTCLVVVCAAVLGSTAWAAGVTATPKGKSKVRIGAYYFDGWSGSTRHVTERLRTEFADREPPWGWHGDSLADMERQIGIAADHGLGFFAFCWYWHDNGGAINRPAIESEPLHTAMGHFLEARNRDRMKFCLLIANHQGFEIKGTEAWKQAADYWIPYFKRPEYLTLDGKPLVIIFSSDGGDKEGFAYLQEAARKAGLPGVAIAACGEGHPELGYTHRTHYNIVPGYTAGGEAHPYSELVKTHVAAWGGSKAQPYLPEVTVGWDARPWERDDGHGKAPGWYFVDRTPEQFADALREGIKWMDKHPDETAKERTMLVYAWNEFGEGGYLAPTKGDPEAKYLKAIQAVLKEAN
jgi:hypothetical protein